MKKELQVGCYVIVCRFIEPHPRTIDEGEMLLTDEIKKITNITEDGLYSIEGYEYLFEEHEIAPLSTGIKLVKETIKEYREQLKLYNKHKKLNLENRHESKN